MSSPCFGRCTALLSLCVLFAQTASGADVGGWYAEQQKAAARRAEQGAATCPQAVALAAADPTALKSYQAAHCYLQGEAPDLVAARAWLMRSAEMNFLPAQRLLRALAAAEAAAHASQRHCHDLGEGRMLCHGGAPPLASADRN
ncbi:MAG: hypothetical protein KIT60_27880 [Burkholderiaceae bacterium]|nr:hypothetical protein [Burkholderiaceae bacterium]